LPDDEVDGHLHIGHALAKAYEDLGEYGNAMEYLRAAKQRKLDNPEEEQPDHRAVFAALEKTVLEDQSARGFASDEPIFIVGMPRTGTTLGGICRRIAQPLTAGQTATGDTIALGA
jgi:hypothetical protein